MYSHKVLTSIQDQIDYMDKNTTIPEIDDPYYRALLDTVKRMPVVHKFHAESYDDIVSSMEKRLHGKFLFTEDFEYIKLPYKICWFDYQYDRKDLLKDGNFDVYQRGLLVTEFSKDLLQVYVYNRIEIEMQGVSFDWQLSPVTYILSVGKTFKERSDLTISSKYLPVLKEADTNVFPLPMMLEMPMEQIIDIKSDDMSDLMFLEAYLKLLNCKNILREKVAAPTKLNKKRRKKGKHPIFDYHVLRIKPSAVQTKSNSKGGLWSNRIHFCRGHYKIFTEDAPLMGKHVGMYWWQPHVRGTVNKVLLKTYSKEK